MLTGLIADNICFYYQQEVILNKLSLTINKGQIVLLTGSSGCGKSTLCYLLAGIYPRYAGQFSNGKVLIDGQDIHQMSVAERAKLISIMFQNPNLQFCMDTVENELIFCLENLTTPIKIIKEKINDAISFCQIEHLRYRQLHTLSGGEKQLVMLACIIALESKYIFLDEPFANVDPITAKNIILKLLAYQQQKQATLIIVEHQIEYFINIADDIIILNKQGQISHRNINKNNWRQFSQIFIDLGIALPAQPYLTNRIVQNRSENRVPLFKLQNVRLPHLNGNVTTEFYLHKITTITGESGCGKTSLLEALARMKNYKGSIQIINEKKNNPQEINKISLKKYTKKIGIVFQNPQDQFITNTVYDELRINFEPSHTNKIEQQNFIQYKLQQVGLWEYRDLSPYMLSQGQQRLLAVTALLACNCNILLCDEPTYGLDRQTATIVMNYLQAKVIKKQLTVILATHDIQLAHDYGDVWYYYQNAQLSEIKKGNDIYA